jgi:hypothetical protein
MIKLKIKSTTDTKYLGTEITVYPEARTISFGDFYFDFDKHDVENKVHTFSSANYIIVAEEI